ncbi:hypothetical protein CNR34_00081 [Pseudomonas phage nickie]|uniref:Uncharacterized protein n=1 Tax=Pseudomonas phage nickie TaxID=2048977 RepID=A0A2H4P751_9CAUD|nr:hypothetical protein FDJ16_gp084 [Pseudomonas phage nickie]ATW58014.1 hypothetical protein CNR34_00081 [Pseudomonas phage nickie]
MASIDFTTVEQYEEAREQIEALLLENHRTMKRAEHLTSELEQKAGDLKEWQDALDKEQDHFSIEKERFEADQHKVLELQMVIQRAVERVNAANQDPIEVINEALLLLELDESPEEIAKLLREKREALDVKW